MENNQLFGATWTDVKWIRNSSYGMKSTWFVYENSQEYPPSDSGDKITKLTRLMNN